jgi:hypothetical protein
MSVFFIEYPDSKKLIEIKEFNLKSELNELWMVIKDRVLF